MGLSSTNESEVTSVIDCCGGDCCDGNRMPSKLTSCVTSEVGLHPPYKKGSETSRAGLNLPSGAEFNVPSSLFLTAVPMPFDTLLIPMAALARRDSRKFLRLIFVLSFG